MAALWHPVGEKLLLDSFYRATNTPTSFKLLLLTSAPNFTMGDFDSIEIANGNGYTTGGQTVNRDSTDFDVWVEDDANNDAEIIMKEFSWTASGGPIPSTGAGATHCGLVDNSNNPIAWWELGYTVTLANGEALDVDNCGLRGIQAAGSTTITNRGMWMMLGHFFRAESNVPSAFKLALSKTTNPPTVDMNLFSGVDEIAAGNGYSAGGISIARSSSGWDAPTAGVEGGRILMVDGVYTASGGPIPSSGGGAQYANVTDTAGTPNLIAYATLDEVVTIPDGNSYTIFDLGFRLPFV